MANAPGAGKVTASTTKLAAAGRADEPSGSRSPQLARGIPGRISIRVRADLARPLLSGRHRQEDRGDLEQADLFLHGKLRQVPRREDAAPRATRSRVSKPEGADRAIGSFYQPLPLPGDQSEASTEPHQGTREDRTDRNSAGRKNDPLLVSAA